MMNAFNAAFLGASAYALPNGTEPLIFLDFKNGVYTVNGSPVAIGAVLAQNADYGSYSPSNIQAGVGLVGAQPVFIGDALALILGGSTIVCTFVLPDPAVHQGRIDFEMIDSTDYNLDISVFSANGASNGCDLNDGDGGLVSEPGLAPGANKIALTLIDGKIARSTNGNPVQSVNPSVAWSPAPQVMLLAAGAFAIIETVGLYPVQADADLPALCDLGYPTNTVAPVITGTAQIGQTLTVSNTAWANAVSIAYQWYANFFGSGGAVPGATANTYLIDAGEVNEGSTMACRVSATNATGTSVVGVIDNDAVIAA